jgi:hypothetical protein
MNPPQHLFQSSMIESRSPQPKKSPMTWDKLDTDIIELKKDINDSEWTTATEKATEMASQE